MKDNKHFTNRTKDSLNVVNNFLSRSLSKNLFYRVNVQQLTWLYPNKQFLKVIRMRYSLHILQFTKTVWSSEKRGSLSNYIFSQKWSKAFFYRCRYSILAWNNSILLLKWFYLVTINLRAYADRSTNKYYPILSNAISTQAHPQIESETMSP